MKITKPTKFVLKISKCGVDSCNGSYNTIENKDALTLAETGVDIMSRDFARSSEPTFKYYLACRLLKQLKGFDKDKLLKDIEKAKEIKFEIQEKKKEAQGNVNPDVLQR